MSEAVSSPSMSGMFTSSRMTANSSLRMLFSASVPERATTSSASSSSSTVLYTSRFSGRSSTMRMRGRSKARPSAALERAAAARNAQRPAAHDLGEPAARGELADERAHFRLARRELGDEAVEGRIEHPAPRTDDVAAQRIGVLGPHGQLHEYQLALEML